MENTHRWLVRSSTAKRALLQKSSDTIVPKLLRFSDANFLGFTRDAALYVAEATPHTPSGAHFIR